MNDIENILGYKFKNPSLLKEALTHPSISLTQGKKDSVFNYERLEFLGDAVISLIIAEFLMNKYPEEREGALAKRHSGLVHGEALASIAEEMGLGKYINMTPGESASGGRTNRSNMENVLEAIVGAIYLDGGILPATAFVKEKWENIITKMIAPPRDAKTALQEWSQARGFPIPTYQVTKTSGPAHEPMFTVSVTIDGKEVIEAEGSSKKKAEKSAAALMLKRISGEETEM